MLERLIPLKTLFKTKDIDKNTYFFKTFLDHLKFEKYLIFKMKEKFC
jgi:hypothetical protein